MAVRADITVTIDGTEVGTLVQASVQQETEMIAAAAEDDYAWEDWLVGARSWSASASVFVPLRGSDTGLVALKTAMLSRASVTTVMTTNDIAQTGQAVITGMSLQASIGGVLTGSISLQGTATLTT